MVLRRLSEWKTAIAEREQLAQMLRHLGRIAEQACEGIVVVDLKGTLHFVNTTWAKMHGYETCNDLLGKQISMFYDADQMKSKVILLSEQAKRGGLSSGTVKNLRKDGTEFHAKIKMIPLTDEKNNINGLMVFVIDITEYKQIENKLKETAEQNETLKQQVEQLQREANRHGEAEQCLKQQVAELNAANGELQHQLNEFRQAESELKKSREQLEQCLAEQRAELKNLSENLQQETEQREQIEKHLKKQAVELTVLNEQLQYQTAERERVENELQKYRNDFEQRVGEQTKELKAADDQLKQEISQRQQAEGHLRRITKSKQTQGAPRHSGGQAGESKESNGPFSAKELKAIADLAKEME
ncbi:MAG: PAS domain S-box protein [Planctomycetota bacterium]|nr:MAG: PAS domain S-box protein [Planctomycetota bacterium]